MRLPFFDPDSGELRQARVPASELLPRGPADAKAMRLQRQRAEQLRHMAEPGVALYKTGQTEPIGWYNRATGAYTPNHGGG